MYLINDYVIKDKFNESKPSEQPGGKYFEGAFPRGLRLRHSINMEHTKIPNNDSLFLTECRRFYDVILYDTMFLKKYII